MIVDQDPDTIRRQGVVGVEEGEQFTPGGGDGRVPGRRRAPAGLAGIPDLQVRTAGLEIPDHPVGPVGGAVVDDRDFQRPVGLIPDTLQGSGQGGLAVPGRDDHADQGIIWLVGFRVHPVSLRDGFFFNTRR